MGDPVWLDDDELQALRAFLRPYRAVMAELDRVMDRECEVPRAYFQILRRLQRTPGHALRMTQLADVTESKASRLSHAVGRLEAAGLVRRERCPEDRRGWRAVLTERGLELVQQAAPVYTAGVRQYLLEALSEEQRAQLIQIGDSILAHLNSGALPLLPDDADGPSDGIQIGTSPARQRAEASDRTRVAGQ